VCASCEREARGEEEEEDDSCGDPLVYATFVAPIQQYSTETEPSRQPSFNSRQPSFNSRHPSENSRQPSENSRQPSENSRQPSLRQNSCETDGAGSVEVRGKIWNFWFISPPAVGSLYPAEGTSYLRKQNFITRGTEQSCFRQLNFHARQSSPGFHTYFLQIQPNHHFIGDSIKYGPK
jgi:hypothetical protein